MPKRQNRMLLVLLAAVLAVPAVAVYGGEKPLPKVPPEYNDHHMPDGWWTEEKVVAAGEKLYQKGFEVTVTKKGKTKTKIQKCAKCHGKKGKPKLRGARDFRLGKTINRFSDGYFFWRVSEGVPKTKMKPMKEWLTEEQRWQVIAYIHAYSHGGKPEPHVHDEIEK